VTWTLTAWLLLASSPPRLLGPDRRHGRKKRTLLIALGAVALRFAGRALAPTIGVLIVGRIIQDGWRDSSHCRSASSGTSSRPSGSVAGRHPVGRHPGGGGLGIVLAGPVVQNLDWRWLFWIRC